MNSTTASPVLIFTPPPMTAAIRTKRLTKRTQVLSKLQAAGAMGVMNTELNPITFRYGACIFELRQQGYAILTECIDALAGKYRFTLLSDKKAA